MSTGEIEVHCSLDENQIFFSAERLKGIRYSYLFNPTHALLTPHLHIHVIRRYVSNVFDPCSSIHKFISARVAYLKDPE